MFVCLCVFVRVFVCVCVCESQDEYHNEASLPLHQLHQLHQEHGRDRVKLSFLSFLSFSVSFHLFSPFSLLPPSQPANLLLPYAQCETSIREEKWPSAWYKCWPELKVTSVKVSS